eukprot:TRINITY_DN1327_c0_g1_i8.p1 TRINITY_DN1327_c0_g1~~TRINITY_DN1327_c0_g1_i8.p1  ORF type:complete len:614 (+),score=107.26 TRINITY_DN1327_c0_g1_i8:76-1917(+)
MKYFLLAALATAAVSAQDGQTRLPPFNSNTPLSNQVYTDITGDNRNPNDITGRTNAVQTRIAGLNFYEDGIQQPRGSVSLDIAGQNLLPSARFISNQICSATGGNPASARSISDWHTFWGQFIDHDFILTAEDPAILFNIEVPPMDPVFTTPSLIFDRSVAELINNVLEQRNLLTSYIDASNVYGETNARANALRTGTEGLLITDVVNGDPENCPACDETLPRVGSPPLLPMANAGIVDVSELYAGGDVRVTENIALASVHTLWVREHNRYAREILAAGICPNNADECIYQEARRRVVAENQAITLGEYSRILFGDQFNTFLGPYQGFNASAVPGCTNEFGVLFRYGHSELNEQIMRFSGRPGAYVDQGPVNLNGAFFNPAMLQNAADVDYILLGNTQQRQREVDNVVSDAVRNTLFITDINDGNTGGDLVARNIQRARDHGHGSFTQLQQQMIDAGIVGAPMAPAVDFSFLGATLQTVFDNTYGVDNVTNADAWPIAISEPRVGTAGLGQTLLAIIGDQYRSIRDGDMFWFENTASPNPFTAQEISELQSMRLSDVILWNTNPSRVEAMQCNAMEDGSNGQTPGGVCENLTNSGSLLVASFGLVASLFVALF